MLYDYFVKAIQSIYINTLFMLIVFDFLTGWLKARKWKVVDSWVGQKGVIKHTMTLIFYFLIFSFALALGAESVGKIIVIIVCLNYCNSIIENLSVMGVFMPEFLKEKVNREIKKYIKLLEEAENEETRS